MNDLQKEEQKMKQDETELHPQFECDFPKRK